MAAYLVAESPRVDDPALYNRYKPLVPPTLVAAIPASSAPPAPNAGRRHQIAGGRRRQLRSWP